MNKWGNHTLAKLGLNKQKSYQTTAVGEALQYLLKHSPFYVERLKEHHSAVENFTSLEDLSNFPTTSKEDLQKQNWNFLCVNKKKIAEFTSTSGTLGEPVTLALTNNDLKRLAYNEYCSFQLMDLCQDDIIQLMLTLDKQFMAGMAYYRGAELLGAAKIRTGPGAAEEQIKTMQKLDTTAIVAVPSFLLKLTESAKENHKSLTDLIVKKVLGIGESLFNENFEPNALFNRIESAWPLEIFSTYASTEMQTAFTSCSQKNGLHLNPELLVVELLDEAGNRVKAGEIGEVTVTTLGVEAMPLLRFRTGDLCKMDETPCACGRNSPRLSGVLGRKNQMIKFKGTTIYPAAIVDLLNKEEWIDNYLIEISHNEIGLDQITIKFDAKDINIDEQFDQLKPKFKSAIRVFPIIQPASAAELLALQFPNGSRKQHKIIDYRT